MGLKGDKWTKRDRWVYRRIQGLEFEKTVQTDAERKKEQELNELRLMITAPILRLIKKIEKGGNWRKLGEALYLFLRRIRYPGKAGKMEISRRREGESCKGTGA